MACGILVPRPGIEPWPQQCKSQILTMRPSGNSLHLFIVSVNIRQLMLLGKPHRNFSSVTVQRFISAQIQTTRVLATLRGAAPPKVAPVASWSLHITNVPRAGEAAGA